MGLTCAKPLPCALVGERKDGLLGVIQNDFCFVFFFQRLARHFVAGLDELAQHGFVAHDLCVVRDIGEVRQPDRSGWR